MAHKKKSAEKVANPDLAAAMRELRCSNAAGTHDPRPNRTRTRAAAKAKALADYQ